jgi:hypothetical protein
LLLALILAEQQQLLIRRRKNSDFQWLPIFSSFRTKTESTSCPVKKEEGNNVCRVICFLLSVNTVRLRFRCSGRSQVFLVSSFNSLFTGRTTTAEKHLLLFYLLKCLKGMEEISFQGN